jgi:hypothetical protein
MASEVAVFDLLLPHIPLKKAPSLLPHPLKKLGLLLVSNDRRARELPN